MPSLILGTHITALGVLRVYHEHGIQSFVVDETSDVIVRSRWYRPAERLLVETADSNELAAFLESLALPRATLAPCSDRWTSAVAGLPASLRERFPASVPPLAAVEQLVDKNRFRALVDRLGIPSPRTLVLNGLEDLAQATDEDLQRGFLKPTDSPGYHRLFGKKGLFPRSRRAAALHIEQARAAGLTLMLQEWIPGNVQQTILIEGFVDRGGTVRGLVARRRLRIDPPKISNTSSSVTIALEEAPEAVDRLRHLLAAVEFRGPFNVEFKFDQRDAHFKIIELNPRLAWYTHHIARAGLDLPWMAYLDAQDLPVPQAGPYRAGRYGLNGIPDAMAIVRALSSGRRPEGRVLRPWLRGDQILFSWRDPLPGVIEAWRSIRRRTRQMLSTARRRATQRRR